MSPIIRIEEDGTRVYSNHSRYKPLDPELRKNSVRKIEGAFRWKGDWLLPLDLLGEDQRQMPTTRPDTDAYDHMTKPNRCQCAVCRRPAAVKWKKLWRREQRQIRRDSSSSAIT